MSCRARCCLVGEGRSRLSEQPSQGLGEEKDARRGTGLPVVVQGAQLRSGRVSW